MVAQKIRDFADKRTNNIEVADEIEKELAEMFNEIVSYCISGGAFKPFRSVGDVEFFLVPASGCLSIRVNVNGCEKKHLCFEREFSEDKAKSQFLKLLDF